MKRILLTAIILCSSFNLSKAGWEIVPTGSTSYLVSVFFINENTGYIGGQNGFLAYTTNAGINWTTQNPGMSSQFVRDITFVNQNTGYICGDEGLIRKTTNAGVLWVPQTTGTTGGIYSIDAVDELNVYATVNNGLILRSTNGGSNYISVNVTSKQLLAIDFSSRDTGYAAGQAGEVFKTTNAGQTWTFSNASTLNNFWDVCALENDKLFLAAYYGTLRNSIDGGTSFKNAYAKDKNFEGIKMVNPMVGYVCGHDGLIMKTTNGGVTWHSQNAITAESLNEIYFINANMGFVIGSGGTFMKTTDGGDNFTAAVISPDNREIVNAGSSFKVKWSGVYTGNTRIEYSLNNGSSWNVIHNSVPSGVFEYDWTVPNQPSSQCRIKITSVDNPSITDVSNGTFAITNATTIYQVPELVYYKFNNGNSTTPNYAVPGEVYGNANITGMSLQAGGISDSCLVGAGGDGENNFVSTNWATYLNPSGWTIGFWVSDLSLGVNPNNAVYLFGDVTANNLRCYYGGSGGLTATDTAIMFRVSTVADIRITVVRGNSYYIHIVYESSPSQIKVYKNGQLFLTQSLPPFIAIGNGPLTIGSLATFASSLASNMKLDEFRIYDRSLEQIEISNTFNITLPSLLTGISNSSINFPEEFKLHNNYPNPFNPVTTIKYEIPKLSFVTLKIYDALGNEVTSAINKNIHAGKYEYTWNASNFSSGVYFYKIIAGDFVEAKSMILLK